MTPGRRFADERGGLQRPVVWLVVLVVAAAAAGSVVLFADEVRRDVPNSEFAVSFDEETRTVTAEHAGGQAITDRTTRRLVLVFEDASAGTTSRVVWVSDVGGPIKRGFDYPVEAGDSFSVDDPTVDADGDENVLDADGSVGFSFDSGDTVRVVWTGSRLGGSARTVTLANATIG
ncbi:MAG: hypothetical protein V5A44_12585 [Haloarculaceae archaeon]